MLTWKAWFKLASRWGIRKTMCFYSLFMTGVGGALFFTLSIFGIISIAWAVGYTIFAGIGPLSFSIVKSGKPWREAD